MADVYQSDLPPYSTYPNAQVINSELSEFPVGYNLRFVMGSCILSLHVL